MSRERPLRREYITLYLTAERPVPQGRAKPSRIILERPIEKSYMRRLHEKSAASGESGLRIWCGHFVKTILPEGGWKLATFSHVKPKRPGIRVSKTDGTYHCSPLYLDDEGASPT